MVHKGPCVGSATSSLRMAVPTHRWCLLNNCWLRNVNLKLIRFLTSNKHWIG
ncbi:hypothetical protein JYU34_019260 [Plutella xylostella]|uniref:Uncharacterized protein n=1 Tax=Plutella xylostella TaxID=51655 RepID=A0ABQ7PWL9_PLUXY|nr:hypothetical protein JYU34_019260 [Plutella xylostella]